MKRSVPRDAERERSRESAASAAFAWAAKQPQARDVLITVDYFGVADVDDRRTEPVGLEKPA